jgi:hypothetical protein
MRIRGRIFHHFGNASAPSWVGRLVLRANGLIDTELKENFNARRPVSALRTQLRSVSDETPNFSAIEAIAAHCEECSSWCSNTILTARSRSSCGYLLGRVMAPTSHESEPPRNAGPIQCLAKGVK